MLSFNRYFGNISVATKWLVSVVLALIQDALITRTGVIMSQSVYNLFVADFLTKRSPQLVNTSTSSLSSAKTASSGQLSSPAPAAAAPRVTALLDILAIQNSHHAVSAAASQESASLFRLKSTWRELWVLLRLVLTVYLFVMSPLRWGFYANALDPSLAADYIVDVVFAADLCFRVFRFHRIQARSGSQSSRLLFNAADILSSVVESDVLSLATSLVATVPWDILAIFLSNWRTVFWIRMLKLGHVSLIGESLAYINQHGRLMPKWKSLVDPILPTVFWLVVTLVASAHLFACGLWLLGSKNFSSADPESASAAVAWFTSGNRIYSPVSSLGDRYLVSLYFVLYTLITVLGCLCPPNQSINQSINQSTCVQLGYGDLAPKWQSEAMLLMVCVFRCQIKAQLLIVGGAGGDVHRLVHHWFDGRLPVPVASCQSCATHTEPPTDAAARQHDGDRGGCQAHCSACAFLLSAALAQHARLRLEPAVAPAAAATPPVSSRFESDCARPALAQEPPRDSQRRHRGHRVALRLPAADRPRVCSVSRCRQQ